MELMLIYLVGIPVNYLIAKAAIRRANEGEWTINDRFPALVTSLLSFLGAVVWGLIYLVAKCSDNLNKPAKW